MTNILREVPENQKFFVIDSSYTTIFGASASNNAFYNSKNTLVGFSFSDDHPQLVELQKFSFYGCQKLKVINLSSAKNLRKIGENAFGICRSVELLLLPNGVTHLGPYAFYYNDMLPKAFLPNSLREISIRLFDCCSSLENVEFESGIQIKNIPQSFLRLTKVKTIIIPKSVKTCDNNAFEDCSTLERIEVEQGSTSFVSDSGVLYQTGFARLVTFPPNHSKKYSIKEECTALNQESFAYSILEEVTIPNSVTVIDSYAFRSTQLVSIKLPKELDSVSSYAFCDCCRLSHVEFPEKITFLSSYSFAGCNFTEIIVPSTVTKLGAFCFANNIYLKKVTLSDQLNVLEGGVFSNCSSDIIIIFLTNPNYDIINNTFIVDKPHENIYQYLGSEQHVVIPKTVKTIKSGAFYQCSFIICVTLEDESILSRIEDKAFQGCSALTSFPFEVISYIGNDAFNGCKSIVSITFGPFFEFIGGQAFRSCQKLENITFVPTKKPCTIGGMGFYVCNSIKTLKLAEGIESIGYAAFYSSRQLTEIYFPSTLKEIYGIAFSSSGLIKVSFDDNCKLTLLSESTFIDCQDLTELHLHQGIQNISTTCFKHTNINSFTVPTGTLSIAEKAFESCANLETFIIPEHSSLIEIGYKIFDGCTSLKTIVSNSDKFIVENSALYNAEKNILYVYPPASNRKYFALSEKVHEILPGAFAGCSHIKIMMIPEDSVVTIGFNAFEGCKNLHYINLPSSINKIGTDAFVGCTSLKCGLTIEEKDQSVINEWISFAGLPYYCTKPCLIPTCKGCGGYRFFYQIFLPFLYVVVALNKPFFNM